MNYNYSRREMIMKTAKVCSLCLAYPVLNPIEMAISIKELVEKIIPSTGEKLPAIGMGTWQTFDVGLNSEKIKDLKEVLKIFVEEGGKVIDSSPMYGRSEEVVGELSSELGLNKKLFLATKVWTTGEQQGIKQMQDSANLLRTEKIDLMQVHNLIDYKVHLKTLKKLKEEGKIKYIGITHYTTGSYPDLMKVMKDFDVDFVQFNYSIQTREAENKILPFAADQGVAVIINRPYEGGSLFSKVKGKNLPDWAADFDCASWGQFFLKYIISHPSVTCAIPATDNPKHMKDNMGAMKGRLPDEKTRKLMVDYFNSIK